MQAGLAAGSGSRVWTNLQRRPFRVSVSLPGGRSFSSEAVLPVLASSGPNAAVTTASHVYSTRVLAAAPAGLVRRVCVPLDVVLDLQLPVVDALFSWDAGRSAATRGSAAGLRTPIVRRREGPKTNV